MKHNYDALYSYYQVIKEGGIRKASKVLGLTPAGVSKQISQLEKKLGTKLLKTNKTGIIVTNEGERYFNIIKKAFPIFDLLEVDQSSDIELSGKIIISTWHGIAVYGITKKIDKFLLAHPKLSIRVKVDNADRQFEDYYSDVVISLKMKQRSDLVQKRVFNSRVCLYASKRYLEKYGEPKDLSDLDHHRLIAASDELDGMYTKTEWHLIEGASKQRKPFYMVNSSTAIEEAIKLDLGIGPLPTFCKPEERGLIRVLNDIEPKELELYYIYPKYASKVKKITELGNFLSNQFLEY